MSTTGSATSCAIVPYVPRKTAEEFLRSFLEKRVSQVCERAFQLTIAESVLLKTYGSGPLFILAGTSSAGKSSIVQKFVIQAPAYREDGIDKACVSFDVDLIKERAPDFYACMAKAMEDGDIASAIFTKNPKVFKKGISEQVRLDATTAIEQTKKLGLKSIDFTRQDLEDRLFGSAIKSSIIGQSVIFDVIEPNNFPEYVFRRNVRAPIKIFLVYCPFEHVLTRVLMRNSTAKKMGDFKEIRHPYQPLNQFADVYCPANSGDTVLEVITKEQVHRTFEKARMEEIAMRRQVAIEERLSPEELDKVINAEVNPDYARWEMEFLERFGFDHTVQSIAITPRYKKYDRLFNTHVMKPKESVAVLSTLDKSLSKA